MDLSTVVGLVLAWGLFISAMLVGGNMPIFIDVPSILIVVGGTFALTLMSFSLPDILAFTKLICPAFFSPKAIRNRIEMKETIDEDTRELRKNLKLGITMLGRMKIYALATGIVGTLIGFIQVLAVVENPYDFTKWSSISLLTALYGTILAYFLFSPLQAKLQRLLDLLSED